MSDLLLIGITIVLNIAITLLILNSYTAGLTEEISKTFDNILDAMKTTMDATFEVRKQIFEKLNKVENENDN